MICHDVEIEALQNVFPFDNTLVDGQQFLVIWREMDIVGGDLFAVSVYGHPFWFDVVTMVLFQCASYTDVTCVRAYPCFHIRSRER